MTITPTDQPSPITRYGIGVVYIGDDNGASIYHMTAKLPSEPGLVAEQFVAAIVTVDRTTRQITLTTPDGARTMATKGLASFVFDDDSKQISGYSVRQYLHPRAAVLLARLYWA